MHDANASESRSSQESETKDDTVQKHVHVYTDYKCTGKTRAIRNAIVDTNTAPPPFHDFIQSQFHAIKKVQSGKNWFSGMFWRCNASKTGEITNYIGILRCIVIFWIQGHKTVLLKGWKHVVFLNTNTKGSLYILRPKKKKKGGLLRKHAYTFAAFFNHIKDVNVTFFCPETLQFPNMQTFDHECPPQSNFCKVTLDIKGVFFFRRIWTHPEFKAGRCWDIQNSIKGKASCLRKCQSWYDNALRT